jgi:outer membrane protein assembly factor BamB
MARLILFALLVNYSLPLVAVADENWPGWRGPHGDGTTADKEVVTHWDATQDKNVVWKVPLSGSGHAQPVIWGDRIFLTACNEQSLERTIACLDRETGKTLWRKTVFRAPLESKHSLNSYASSTPATDGKLVFVSFLEVDGRIIPAPNVGTPRDITTGNMVVAAFDFEGNQKWLVKPGGFISAHGFCSSPVLFENLVILNGDHDGDSYLVALEKQTGKVVWKHDREYKIRSYATPLIREIDGRTQLMLPGSKHVLSVHPRDGKVHWKIEGPTEQFVASPVFDGERLFLAAGYPDDHVMAIRPDGSGDVTATHVAWHETKVKCYVPSPVVVNGYLIVADDRGTVNCFAADSGKRWWLERLGSHYSNSLVTANGLVYLVDDDGLTKVVRPDPKLEMVAENPLGESCYSSPAIARGRFYIRGEQHLFCLGEK